MKVYFDNAATTPMAPEIIEHMSEVMRKNFGNPSSVHEFGRKSKIIIETSRKKIASLLNTAPKNIFFTSGGTEADNMAINSAIKDHEITHAITSKLSHHAVLLPLQDLANEGKIKLSYVEVNKNGLISLADLEKLLSENKRTFVSIMHANNEIGVIQDIKSIGDICSNYNAIFHSDTVQTMAHYPFNMQQLDIDFIVASAHKFHGPKGVGFLYISEDIQIKPFIRGGGQERNMRAGTENIYAISALSKAMEMSYNNLDSEMKYIKDLKSYMIQRLNSEIPDIYFHGDSSNLDSSLYTIISVSFPEIDAAEMLLFNLDIMGIACSGGSACASGSSVGSHVLSAIDSKSERPTIRFSFSKYNTVEEIDYTISKLKQLFI